jgi:hypothetical protein
MYPLNGKFRAEWLLVVADEGIDLSIGVARRMSFTTCSAGSLAGPDFCFISAPRKATMNQKSSLPQSAESVS